MLEQRTIIDQIETKRDGTVQLRLVKEVISGTKVISSGYHRAMWEPGDDFETGAARVNAHLVQMEEAPVTEEEWERVKRVIEMEHTPDVVVKYKAKKEAEAAKQPKPPGV